MVYDYELKLKPWQEITRLANFVDSKGANFDNFCIHKDMYAKLNLETLYAIDIGFMGLMVYFRPSGKQISCKTQDTGIFKLYDYSRTTKEVIKYNKKNSGSNSEEHY